MRLPARAALCAEVCRLAQMMPAASRQQFPACTHAAGFCRRRPKSLRRSAQGHGRRRLPSAAVPLPDCQKSRFAKNNAQKVFARLFRKGGGVKGRSPWRVPQDAKSFAFIRIRKGDATARWAVASWETLSRGFPMRRLTPHLGNLLSANQFFDTLGRLLRIGRRRFLPAAIFLIDRREKYGIIKKIRRKHKEGGFRRRRGCAKPVCAGRQKGMTVI